MEIVPMILLRLKETIETQLKNGVPEDDVSRITLVKVGLLQENKLGNRISVGVTGGDHEKPDYIDGIVSLDVFEDIHFTVPAREFGGGGSQAWWRRGVVRVEAFLLNEGLDEWEATQAAYEAKRRLVEVIENLDVNGLVDDSGERVLSIFCPMTTFFESGGKPSSFIFRGKLFWFAVTSK